MNTMTKLVKRFNRAFNPVWIVAYHPEWSDTGNYVMWVTDPCGSSSRQVFTSCNEFRRFVRDVWNGIGGKRA